jgi:hypothetical protein
MFKLLLKIFTNLKMKKYFLLSVYLFAGSIKAQFKIPRYSFSSTSKVSIEQSAIQYNHDIFQFFYDSTFSLISYNTIGKCYIIKTERYGRYLKSGDTLFLKDSISQYYPLTKEKNYSVELANDMELKLFPARIILGKDVDEYISYLNHSRKIYVMKYSEITALEKRYQADTKDQLKFFCY